jgi:hypothetical protein
MSTPTTPAARRPLTLAKPVQNTIDGATVVQAKRSPQRHILPTGSTTTLCGIDVTKWAAQADVDADAKTNCPLCVKAMRAAKTDA